VELDCQDHEDGASKLLLMSVKHLLIFVGSYRRRLLFMFFPETISLYVGV